MNQAYFEKLLVAPLVQIFPDTSCLDNIYRLVLFKTTAFQGTAVTHSLS
jgi:hypothetical protein